MDGDLLPDNRPRDRSEEVRFGDESTGTVPRDHPRERFIYGGEMCDCDGVRVSGGHGVLL
jgi:hypothetical protein